MHFYVCTYVCIWITIHTYKSWLVLSVFCSSLPWRSHRVHSTQIPHPCPPRAQLGSPPAPSFWQHPWQSLHSCCEWTLHTSDTHGTSQQQMDCHSQTCIIIYIHVCTSIHKYTLSCICTYVRHVRISNYICAYVCSYIRRKSLHFMTQVWAGMHWRDQQNLNTTHSRLRCQSAIAGIQHGRFLQLRCVCIQVRTYVCLNICA